MAYWNWDSSYEIGINVIDNQHKRIISYINELHEALTGGDNNKVATVLMDLTDYTVSHFAFEESLMEKAGYPLTEPHKKVHEKFVTTVGNYTKRFNEGEDIVGKLMAELQIWLTHHILNDDRDYKESVQNLLSKNSDSKSNQEVKKKSWFERIFG